MNGQEPSSEHRLRAPSAKGASLLQSLSPKVIGVFASLLIKLLEGTLRWKKVGLIRDGKHWSLGEPIILVFWHGDQLMMPFSYRLKEKNLNQAPIHALVSLHADGRIAAETIAKLSIHCVDGSSSKGGTRALLGLKQKLKAGEHVAITPDGPRGPRHEAKIGASLLSSMSGAAILPIAIAVKHCWTFGSWDKMFLPKPFSPAAMVMGDSIRVPKKLSRDELENSALLLGKTLRQLKEDAERLLEEEAGKEQALCSLQKNAFLSENEEK